MLIKCSINSKYRNGEWSKVPTLVFPNGDIKFDSLKIAKYLDNNYFNNPLNPNNLELDKLIEYYDNNCYKTSFKMCVLDIFNSLEDDNKRYFRDTKEPNFKAKVEDYPGNREKNIEAYFKNIKPIVERLEINRFLDGNEPLIHDYCLMGRIQMIKTISPQSYKELVESNPSEVFKGWVESMSSLFNGYLKSRKTVLSD
jgi:glutathione S-transferase